MGSRKSSLAVAGQPGTGDEPERPSLDPPVFIVAHALPKCRSNPRREIIADISRRCTHSITLNPDPHRDDHPGPLPCRHFPE